MGQFINNFILKYFDTSLYFPSIRWVDVLEIIIITILIYHLINWINNTKAWMLLKGILVMVVFVLVAYLLEMHTILYIVKHSVTVMATAAIVVFQPELRRALEKLGEKQFISSVLALDKNTQARFNDETKEDIIAACFAMGRVKTGALIVVERAIQLTEYESTGIKMDAVLSKQLLLNIFEHNTPLHDGAIIVRGDRIVAATCYLPLSDNTAISKELGTRHRAALGLTEVSDAVVIVVSEETGNVSLASGGDLYRNIDEALLRDKLTELQAKMTKENRILKFIRRRKANER
ncbi:diadenylate cyclase CdaA [Lachnospiraceae bacterium OttesenSCG-928-J05]|nr:diadenylate cyclase CdaA [Lachnospiraceae bacterium OttesenSCG-928-J05]